MKPNKKVAAVAAGALVASAGVASIALAGAAQATTSSFTLYSQIKKTTLQSTSYGPNNVTVTMTVTPASASPGTPLTIAVSSTLAMKNGPAANAAANSEEADAVVNFNGVDYVLRGSQNNQIVNYDDSELGGTETPNTLFNGGWITSSAPGASSSSSTNTTTGGGAPAGTVAGTTGIGATIRGAEATPVSIVAPAVGVYPLTLKAIVANAIAGTSTVALTDDFDNVYNTVNCTASCAANGNYAQFNTNNAASYIDPFSPAVSFTSANLPAFTINKVTTQNNTYDVPGSSSTATAGAGGLGYPAIRQGDFFEIQGTNSAWTASSRVFGTICVGPNAHASCAPAGAESAAWAGTVGGYTLANGFSTTTDGSGNLPAIPIKAASLTTYAGPNTVAIYQTTTRPAPPGYSGANTQGPVSAGVTAEYDRTLFFLNTATYNRTLAVTGAPVSNVASGASVAVTGSNYYPGESVTIGGADTTGAPVAGTSTTVTANANGGIAGNITAAAGVTRAYSTGHGPTGDVTTTTADGDISVSLTSCTVVSPATSCTTAQSLYATVTAGLLSQAASLTNACVAPATSESPTLPSGPAFNPVNGCNSAVSKIGFGAVQTKSVAQTLTGTLNTITVTDLRGGLTGWSLVATVPAAFTNGGSGTIPANNITINTASCTPSVGSAPGCTPAAAAAVFNGVTLAQKLTGAGNLNAGGSTSGTYDVAATLDLNVPAFQPTGLYSTTATFTLS